MALSFSPDIDTICDTTLEIDSTNSCWEKLIWIQFNHDEIKPLGFDSRSNTSSWRLFFKSSVSYPHFWSPNSFYTYKEMNCSLQILKTLHLVRIRKSGVALQWCNASRIGASSVRSRDHRQLCVNHLIPKYQKYSTGWLSATTIKCLLKNAIVKTKFQNTAIPWPVTAKISLVIFFAVCFER